MEFLEILWALADGSCCFLDIVTWTGAGGAGVQARRKFKARKADIAQMAREREQGLPVTAQEQKDMQRHERSMWIFLILFIIALALAVTLTVLTLRKWLS